MSINRLVMTFALSDLASKGIKAMASNVRGLGEAGAEAAGHLEEMGQAAAQGVKAAEGMRQLGQALKPALDTVVSMEAAMKRLEVNLGAASAAELTAELEAARTVADAIQLATPFSSEQVLDGAITGLSKAGFSLEDVLADGGGAQASAYLATAEGSGIEAANDAVITLASKFGLLGSELSEGADALVRFGAAANTNGLELGQALSQVKGAAEMGLGINETLGLLAVSANAGLQGTAGGTATSAFIRQLGQLDGRSKGQLSAFDEDGAFKGLAAVTDELRTYFGGLTTEKQQQEAQDLFGDEGKGVLFALLEQERGSIEQVLAGAAGARGLDERVGVIADGVGAQQEALGGSTSSLVARLFEPLLEPARAVTSGANEAVGALSEAAAEDARIGQAVSGAAVTAMAGLGAVAALRFGKAGMAGMRGLGALRRIPGAGALGGIAGGKVAEELAGVTPVFVTNWPGGFGGGLAEAAGSAAASGGIGAGLKKMGAKIGATAAATLGASRVAKLGAVAARLGPAGAVLGAGAAGYGAGRVVDNALIGQETQAEAILHGLLAATANTFGTQFMSDETVGINDAAAMRGWDALREAIGLEVTVNNYPDGRTEVRTSGLPMDAVDARQGVG
jgi:TP901 family phage tail tape measure protein